METTDLSYYSLWESGAMEMGGSIKLFSMGWYFARFRDIGHSMGIIWLCVLWFSGNA